MLDNSSKVWGIVNQLGVTMFNSDILCDNLKKLIKFSTFINVIILIFYVLFRLAIIWEEFSFL